MEENLISAHKAAKHIGIPASTFYSWIDAGKVEPDFKASQNMLFTPMHVAQLRIFVRRVGSEAIGRGEYDR